MEINTESEAPEIEKKKKIQQSWVLGHKNTLSLTDIAKWIRREDTKMVVGRVISGQRTQLGWLAGSSEGLSIEDPETFLPSAPYSFEAQQAGPDEG